MKRKAICVVIFIVLIISYHTNIKPAFCMNEGSSLPRSGTRFFGGYYQA